MRYFASFIQIFQFFRIFVKASDVFSFTGTSFHCHVVNVSLIWFACVINSGGLTCVLAYMCHFKIHIVRSDIVFMVAMHFLN